MKLRTDPAAGSEATGHQAYVPDYEIIVARVARQGRLWPRLRVYSNEDACIYLKPHRLDLACSWAIGFVLRTTMQPNDQYISHRLFELEETLDSNRPPDLSGTVQEYRDLDWNL